MMKYKTVFIIAGFLLAAAAFMKFVMIGYSFLALVLCAVAAAMIMFVLLPTGGRIVLTIAIAAFLAVFSYWEVRIVKASKCDPPADADYLIVLGCGVRGTTPSIAMGNRTDAAAAYMKKNPGTIAVCSGGQGSGEDITEALAMKKLLCSAGIEESRILMESRSTSTEENLMYSMEVIKEDLTAKGSIDDTADAMKIVICSSEYHIFRALYMTEYLFSEDEAPSLQSFYGLPAHSTLPISRIGYFMREAAGMIAVKVLRK